MSLIPLTLGVMLACSFDVSASNFLGLLSAFGSALVFVSSNMFFKRIMPSDSSHSAHKPDKLNLLLYSSSAAFCFMIPLFVYHDLPRILSGDSGHPSKGHENPHSVAYYLFLNGTVHFAQNILAFVILASTSPVTYSIASLVKRVAVICAAVMYFRTQVHIVQALGICLTAVGLWAYHQAKNDVERGERNVRRHERARLGDLPLGREDADQEAIVEGDDRAAHISESISTGATGRVALHGRPRGHSVTHGAHGGMVVPPPPPLHIKITPPPSEGTGPSPISYPSPPPSLDSPPRPPPRHLPHSTRED